MDGGGDEVEVGHGPRPVRGGEFDGWLTWQGEDAFEDQSGPFYFRQEANGSVRCAFRAEARHMNGGGFMHGGCLMTFADFCLFAISHPPRKAAGLDGPSVTVSMNAEFLGPGRVGDLVEATGEVTRLGAGLIFVRGLVFAGERRLLNFSGVIRRMKSRP